MIKYREILNKNMLNVLKDILVDIKNNGIRNTNQFYITFKTNHKNVKLPNWLKLKYPEYMTVIIQHEYYNIEVQDKYFSIMLSFNDIKTELHIGYNSILSFSDPTKNFGFIFDGNNVENNKEFKKDNNTADKRGGNKNNILNFRDYKK